MNKYKDVILAAFVLVAIGGLYFYYKLQRNSQQISYTCVPNQELTSIQSGGVENNWKEYNTKAGFSFKYPSEKLNLNDLNNDAEGVGSYGIVIPDPGSYDRVVWVEISKEMPTEEGWTSEEIYNNQNPLPAQLQRLSKSAEQFNFTPCPPNEDVKTVVQSDDGLFVLMKKGDKYLMAGADLTSFPEYNEDIKEILTSIQ